MPWQKLSRQVSVEVGATQKEAACARELATQLLQFLSAIRTVLARMGPRLGLEIFRPLSPIGVAKMRIRVAHAANPTTA